MDIKRCPDCDSSEFISDPESGELICKQCGLVLDVDTQASVTLESPQAHVSPRKTSSRVSPQTLARMRKIERYNARFRSSIGRKTEPARREIDRLSSSLHIPEIVSIRSLKIYTRALRSGMVLGRSSAAFAAASIYAACREAGIPRPIKQIADVSTRDLKEISRYYRLLVTGLGMKMPTDEPLKFVPRLSSIINISPKTERIAVNILRSAIQSGVIVGKDPKGMVAAALYMACNANKEKCTQKDIAKAARTTEVTLRKRLRQLEAMVGQQGFVSLFQ